MFGRIASLWPVTVLVKAAYWIFARCAGALSRAHTYSLWPDARQKDAYVYWNARVKYPENITFGKGLRIGPRVTLGAHSPIMIGDNVRISEGAFVETGNLDLGHFPPGTHVSKPTSIGDGVWIGAKAMVLGGVTIGEHSVIGAGAVVSRDVAPYSIVVSASARIFPRKR